MCRRHPRGRARSRVPKNMPSAVLVLLRTPDNKFFETPIHERRACKSATFSHRRLRSAIRRRPACCRKAGRSMEFHRPRRFRGDLQDIQRTVEETSTRVLDRKTGLARCRPRLPILAPRARSLRWPVAIRLAPAAPERGRLERAALAQSAGSAPEIGEISAGGEKDPIHRADGDRRKTLAHLRELSGVHGKGLSERLRPACSNGVLPRRTDRRRRVRWRDGYGDPTSHQSSLGSGFAGDVVVPGAVERPRPGPRDVTVNHGAKATLFENRAHVHVNQKQSNRNESHARMNQNRGVAHEPEAPRESFRVPQHTSGQQQENYAVENSPKEKLLSKVEAADRREFVVFIFYVIRDCLSPGAIGVGNLHVAMPLCKCHEEGQRKKQSKPWVPESCCRPASHDSGQPVKIGRPECEARDQQIGVRKRAEPMIYTLKKRISDDRLLVFAGA